MTTLPERLLARARKLEAVRDMLGIPACDYADQPHIDMLREAATALQPSAGGVVAMDEDSSAHPIRALANRLIPIAEQLDEPDSTTLYTARAHLIASTFLASPAQPSGFVLVPVEPTERMVVDGFESRPDPIFTPEIWDEYEAMTGCQQAAYEARLCWAAMIAAAPSAPIGQGG